MLAAGAFLIPLLVCGLPLALLILLAILAALVSYFSPQRRRDRREKRRMRDGRGLSVSELARRLRLPEADLAAFTPRYSPRQIPKRRGGTRTLLIPDPATKTLQRKILRLLLARLHVHPAAMGFEKGRSIVTNALPHAGQAVLIKLDIIDFFPSTSAARLDIYFRRIGWDQHAAALLVRLTTHDGGLPQGAPTSPRLSNLVNHGLDAQLAAFAQKRKCTYTRYADDITFSCPKDYPRRVRGLVQRTNRVLRAVGYRPHTQKKLAIVRQHQQQRVTGLVVNTTPNLPRATRRRLRAIAHHLATGRPATLTPTQLAGYHALQHMIATQSQPFGAPSPPA